MVEAYLRCSNLDAAIQYLQEAKGRRKSAELLIEIIQCELVKHEKY